MLGDITLQYNVREVLQGVAYGSDALQSMQNISMPVLDLLVREAIQNSSDASLAEKGKRFAVSFNTGFFNQPRFNSCMTGLADVLNKKYAQDKYQFIEIRDLFTSGLTGPTRLHELSGDHGNFFKLVFDTGKKQDKSESGGHWGYGKSVYFRAGIGIVIFYSQIENDEGEDESRLVIAIVEDEDKTTGGNLLSSLSRLPAGKAWWGLKDGDEILPVTDKVWIGDFLSSFEGITPFEEGEHGTSIIIPYVDPEKLLKDIILAEMNDDDSGDTEVHISKDIRRSFIAQCGSDLSSYIKLAAQKWYAPKINNLLLPKICPDRKILNISINNTQIRKDEMLPLFSVVQDLYNIALANAFGIKELSDGSTVESLPLFSRTICKDINIQGILEHKKAGCVAFVKLLRSELCHGSNLLSPYNYIGAFGKAEDCNTPIVMYAREPGMIIEYSVSGEWGGNLPSPESKDEILIAFFVPYTSQKFKVQKEFCTLGDYLRSCEASDHCRWVDQSTLNIIERIQGHVSSAIKDYVNNSDRPNIPATVSRLSRKLGQLLMPSLGSKGKASSGGGTGSSGGGGGLGKQLNFSILSQKIHQDYLDIEFNMKFFGNNKKAEMEIVIDSEEGQLNQVSWTSKISTSYPAHIQYCQIDQIHSDVYDSPKNENYECSEENKSFENDVLKMDLASHGDDSLCTYLIIGMHIIHAEINGVIRLQASDRKFRYSLAVK